MAPAPTTEPSAADLERAQRLLKILCGTAARRQALRHEAANLGARVAPATLARVAERQRLLGLLAPRLRELGLDALAAGVQELLGERPALWRARAVELQLVTLGLLAGLGAEGVTALPLKGPLLGEALYGDAAVRPSDDVDLLVARADLHTAARLVVARGYRQPTDPTDAAGLPLLHLCLRAPDAAPNVEIHWRLHWHATAFSREMLERSVPDARRGRSAPDDDELAALLLFYARDGFAGLRLAADLAAFWDHAGARFGDRPALDAVVRRFPELRRTLATATAVAEATVGLPAERVLGPGAVARSRLALGLANWTMAGDAQQIRAEQGLLDVVLAPRGNRRATLRRQLLPTAEQMAWRMRNAPEGDTRTGLILHPIKTTARWLRALGTVLARQLVSTRRASRRAGTA